MTTVCTILCNKFDFQVKKGVGREPPTLNVVELQSGRRNFTATNEVD